MTKYIADWMEGDQYFSVRFVASSWRRAENIARRKGWTLIGEFIDEQECPADIAAQIEKHVTNPTVH